MQGDENEKNMSRHDGRELPPQLVLFREEMIVAQREGIFEAATVPVQMLDYQPIQPESAPTPLKEGEQRAADGVNIIRANGEETTVGVLAPPTPPPMVVFSVLGQAMGVMYNEREGYVAQVLLQDNNVRAHTSLRLAFARAADKGQLVSLFLAAVFLIRDTEMLAIKASLHQQLRALDGQMHAMGRHENSAMQLAAEHWPFERLRLKEALDRLLDAHGAKPASAAPAKSAILFSTNPN